MNLRQRLFVLISSLFIIAFVVSTIFEDRLTKSYLLSGEKKITDKIINENQMKLKHLEEFLLDLLLEVEANIEAVLERIQQHAAYKAIFEEGKSWHGIATVLMTNRWIDFIQVGDAKKVNSGVMVRNEPLKDAVQIPLDKGLALYFVRNDPNNWIGPFIGINLNITQDGGPSLNPHFWVLFGIDEIINFRREKADLFTRQKELAFPPFFSEQEQFTFQKSFFDRIEAAQKFLKKHPDLIPQAPQTAKSYQDRILQKYNERLPPPEKETEYDKILQHYKDRYLEIEMIWNMTVIFLTPPSISNVIGIKSPVGMVAHYADEQFGNVILNREILFKKPYFDISDCEKEFSKLPLEICHNKALSVVSIPEKNRLFFANALDLRQEAYVAIGIDGAEMLRKLALATHETTLFVSGDKVLKAYNGDGDELEGEAWKDLPLKEILEKDSGIIPIDGVDYFFLHLDPTESEDFHFFLFTPKEKEFALVDTLDDSVQEVISKISLQMRIAAVGALLIVLLFLNGIAKRITQPITALAKATISVEKGELDAVNLPHLKHKKNDEVSTLYHSFSQMVQGLKEKEKVRGVLNKVVSRDIAEEILKGNIHLGGEEKNVTVLFADIRNFTGLTQNMPPAEVIEFLNSCMTKVSVVIDAHGGVIDKFVGDEVMALFGAPVEKADSAKQAVSCGLNILQALSIWNEERKGKNLPPIEMGIGIHTGLVVAGNMGAENRLNYTVLGSNVNLASRLCSSAAPHEILISKSTRDDPQVSGQFQFEEIADLSLKGFTETITAYRVKSL